MNYEKHKMELNSEKQELQVRAESLGGGGGLVFVHKKKKKKEKKKEKKKKRKNV